MSSACPGSRLVRENPVMCAASAAWMTILSLYQSLDDCTSGATAGATRSTRSSRRRTARTR